MIRAGLFVREREHNIQGGVLYIIDNRMGARYIVLKISYFSHVR
jgi:hypothetical protein